MSPEGTIRTINFQQPTLKFCSPSIHSTLLHNHIVLFQIVKVMIQDKFQISLCVHKTYTYVIKVRDDY